MSGAIPSSDFLPINNAKSVIDFLFPSCIVRGAEKTAITLESCFNCFILFTISLTNSPSIPLALPPNFATTSFAKSDSQKLKTTFKDSRQDNQELSVLPF